MQDRIGHLGLLDSASCYNSSSSGPTWPASSGGVSWLPLFQRPDLLSRLPLGRLHRTAGVRLRLLEILGTLQGGGWATATPRWHLGTASCAYSGLWSSRYRYRTTNLTGSCWRRRRSCYRSRRSGWRSVAQMAGTVIALHGGDLVSRHLTASLDIDPALVRIFFIVRGLRLRTLLGGSCSGGRRIRRSL